MNNHWKEIIGYSLSTIGTIQAAVGSTPQFNLPQSQSYQWRMIGNVLQALGSALAADGQGGPSLEKLGDNVQAVGNSTVLTGMLLYGASDIELEQKLVISGNWMQALGSFTGLADEFFDSTEKGRAENIIGNLLQGIGNAMQAVSGVQALDGNNSLEQAQLGVAGSWIQTAGSILSLIGESLEELQEVYLNISE